MNSTNVNNHSNFTIFFPILQICSELQEFHGSIDTFLKNSEAQVTLQDIENLALQEDALSTKVRELKEKREILDENIQMSLNEAISIIEQSLEAVRKKMYGDFGDHKTLTTTAQKVQDKEEKKKKKEKK